ncbi:MAG TPA: hypothetical protein VHG51_07820 [Longimicrobiaceae bacterium]|nr:hypothetical protein [Longimicrobiaceae bacterium]
MTDQEIAKELQRRGLEVEYLRELAAALGFAEEEGWSEAVFLAIEVAEMQVRRKAALRTLEMGRDRAPPGAGNA